MVTDTPYPEEALAALVDHRSEEPGVEYKAWLDLADNEAKAKLAKHFCALTNYGGGTLIFGVNDDGSHCEPHPGNLDAYRQDAINDIVGKYLVPPFHCDVVNVTSRVTGKAYPVVRVPPHGRVPVCAKRGGPQKDGKPVGITKGIHYTRVPGPKSVAIDGPELWREVIHRCVVNERESLLASIGRLFDRPTQVEAVPDFDRWLDDAVAWWEEIQPASAWSVDLKANRVAFAFRLLDGQGRPVEPLSVRVLAEAIRTAAWKAESESGSGWGYFTQAGVGPHRPTVAVFDDVEGYEAAMVAENGSYGVVPSAWRVAGDGRGVEVRAYQEDNGWVTEAVNSRRSRTWVSGERFSPWLQAATVYEFVAFVRALGSHFEGVEQVDLAADYRGLSGRIIDDPKPRVHYRLDRRASKDDRRVRMQSSLEALAGDGAAGAAAAMIAPIGRLFDGWEITADFVRHVIRRR